MPNNAFRNAGYYFSYLALLLTLTEQHNEEKSEGNDHDHTLRVVHSDFSSYLPHGPEFPEPEKPANASPLTFVSGGISQPQMFLAIKK
jgi:hypothetical protein